MKPVGILFLGFFYLFFIFLYFVKGEVGLPTICSPLPAASKLNGRFLFYWILSYAKNCSTHQNSHSKKTMQILRYFNMLYELTMKDINLKTCRFIFWKMILFLLIFCLYFFDKIKNWIYSHGILNLCYTSVCTQKIHSSMCSSNFYEKIIILFRIFFYRKL